MVFLVQGKDAENIEKKAKSDRRKYILKRERKAKDIGKTTAIKIFGFTFYIKNHILLENIV